MQIQIKRGDHVIYVDEVGQKHDALITANWGNTIIDTESEPKPLWPSVNLVFVLKEPDRTDQYGQQKDHRSSCVHRSNQYAPGNYWYHPSEPEVKQ